MAEKLLREQKSAQSAANALAAGVIPVTELPIPESLTETLRVQAALSRIEALLDTLNEGLNKDSNIFFTNFPVIIPKDNKALLIEDFTQLQLQVNDSYNSYGNNVKQSRASGISLPNGLSWRFPRGADADNIIHSLKRELESFSWSGNRIDSITCGCYSAKSIYNVNSTQSYGGGHWNTLDIKVSDITGSLLRFVVDHRLIPKFLADPDRLLLTALFSLLEGRLIEFGDEESDGTFSLDFTDAFCGLTAAKKGQYLQSFLPADIFQAAVSEKSADILSKVYLEADFKRADILAEDMRKLEDPNGGLWELWDAETACAGKIRIPKTVYARDPRLDVVQGGVIGIDFGTKSTVVTHLDGSDQIRPMRVGTGRYENKVNPSDYENPTVMEFVDLGRFKERYEAEEGRPHTLWEDLTVSYTANGNLAGLGSGSSARQSAAYFTDLKQWAGGSRRNLRIVDISASEKGGEGVTLPPFMELTSGAIDPIEYYAYYIGLYINNMRTRRIYLEYLLSFPVTYPRAVRERILASFRRGLRKSLPPGILNDAELMEGFSVEEGAGEPAAYAVCALQEFGFKPQEGETEHFSVFDFGGGTSDFDFGIWRRAVKTSVKERRYNYVIEHFKPAGDGTLGGENLLAELAYRVFIKNQDLLRENEIQFTRSPDGKPFAGDEALVDSTQEARTNSRTLAELLRPVWERKPAEGAAKEEAERKAEEARKAEESFGVTSVGANGELIYTEAEPEFAFDSSLAWMNPVFQDGVIKARFYQKNGDPKELELKVDETELMEFLWKRIEEGVDRFFHALGVTSENEEEAGKREERQTLNVFLAGNASRSLLFQEIFHRKIEIWEKRLRERDKGSGLTGPDRYFRLFYPLGTPEADAQIKERGGRGFQDYRPNSKTGVAVGLLLCRKGGKIRVVNEIEATEEIKFRCWVGDGVDGLFVPIIPRGAAYNQWVEYYPADLEVFEFRYTADPIAESGNLPADRTRLERRRLPKEALGEDRVICLRPVGPEEIEYAVTDSLEAAERQEYRCQPVRVRLGNV